MTDILAGIRKDAPRLLDAVEAVLDLADEWEASSDARALVTRQYAAECFRAAIMAALAGGGKR